MVIVDAQRQNTIVPQTDGAVIATGREKPVGFVVRQQSTDNASGAEVKASSLTVGAIKGQKRVLVFVDA